MTKENELVDDPYELRRLQAAYFNENNLLIRNQIAQQNEVLNSNAVIIGHLELLLKIFGKATSAVKKMDNNKRRKNDG